MKFVKIIINGEELYRKVEDGSHDGSADVFESLEDLTDVGDSNERLDTVECDSDFCDAADDDSDKEKIRASDSSADDASMPRCDTCVSGEGEKLFGKILNGAKDVWEKVDKKTRSIVNQILHRTDCDKKD